ncbi:MAG: gamma-glutamyl-gamma-aminobutyrate hydrolase family protein [Clostridia bacterium]
MQTSRRLPRIGVVGYYISEDEAVGGRIRGIPRQSFVLFSYDMIRAVSKAGAIPIPLPVVPKEEIPHQLSVVDGLVFSGGEDLDPQLYGEKLQPTAHRVDPVRDKYEMELMEASLALNIPTLCVCRGMQLLNVFCGGTLYSDISEISEEIQNHWEVVEPWKGIHPVSVKADHFAANVLGGSEIYANSIHHQSVKDLGKGLEVIGVSEDNVVEAIAMQGRDDVLAVQWHPEMIARKDKEGLRPFQWLAELASEKMKEKNS